MCHQDTVERWPCHHSGDLAARHLQSQGHCQCSIGPWGGSPRCQERILPSLPPANVTPRCGGQRARWSWGFPPLIKSNPTLYEEMPNCLFKKFHMLFSLKSPWSWRAFSSPACADPRGPGMLAQCYLAVRHRASGGAWTEMRELVFEHNCVLADLASQPFPGAWWLHPGFPSPVV